jgi:hypothetical protein
MNTRILAVSAAACLLAVSTSACSTLGGLPGGSASGASDFVNAVSSLNDKVLANCNGTVTLDWHPPLPPAGGLNFTCTKPQATMVPLSQVQSLLPGPVAIVPPTQ